MKHNDKNACINIKLILHHKQWCLYQNCDLVCVSISPMITYRNKSYQFRRKSVFLCPLQFRTETLRTIINVTTKVDIICSCKMILFCYFKWYIA